MNNKYLICYKTKTGDMVSLVAVYKKKKGLLDLDSLKKLFSITFKDENYNYETSLLYRHPLHGNINKVNLNKREISEVFLSTKRNSFNFNGTRIKFIQLVITKDKVKELTEGEFSLADPSLIHFIELTRAKLNSLGYIKCV